MSNIRRVTTVEQCIDALQNVDRMVLCHPDDEQFMLDTLNQEGDMEYVNVVTSQFVEENTFYIMNPYSYVQADMLADLLP